MSNRFASISLALPFSFALVLAPAGVVFADPDEPRPDPVEAPPQATPPAAESSSKEVTAEPEPSVVFRRHRSDPEHLAYRPGKKAPAGYALEESPRYNLVAGGAALAGGLHLVSMIAAMALDAEADQTIIDQQGGTRSDPEFASRYTAMFIPFVGPFITIKTADARGTGLAILAMDGVAQLAGAGLFTAGWLAPKKRFTKEDVALTVVPMFADGGGGLELVGSF